MSANDNDKAEPNFTTRCVEDLADGSWVAQQLRDGVPLQPHIEVGSIEELIKRLR